MATECPHVDVRRARYVVDGQVVVACEDCRELGVFWNEVMTYAKPPLDDEALVEDLHGLCLLLDAAEWWHEQAHKARAELGREINRVYKLYNAPMRNHSTRITWPEIAEAMGLTVHGVDWYRDAATKKQPKREHPDRFTAPQMRAAQAARRRSDRALRVSSNDAASSNPHRDQDGAVHPGAVGADRSSV